MSVFPGHCNCRASQLSATTQPLPELQASRPALPSIASPPSNSSSLSQMPPSLSSQNRTVHGRKRTISDILKKGKQKAPHLVSWDKNIVCLPEDYCGNNRVTYIYTSIIVLSLLLSPTIYALYGAVYCATSNYIQSCVIRWDSNHC